MSCRAFYLKQCEIIIIFNGLVGSSNLTIGAILQKNFSNSDCRLPSNPDSSSSKRILDIRFMMLREIYEVRPAVFNQSTAINLRARKTCTKMMSKCYKIFEMTNSQIFYTREVEFLYNPVHQLRRQHIQHRSKVFQDGIPSVYFCTNYFSTLSILCFSSLPGCKIE